MILSRPVRSRRWIAALAFLATACSQAAFVHPCPGAAVDRRQPGETVLRQRDGAAKMLLFVQRPIGPSVGPDLFWPERVVDDDLFGAYDVHVLALPAERSTGCATSPEAEARVAMMLRDRLHSNARAVLVTNDVRNLPLLERALQNVPAGQRARVVDRFLFHTPASDAIARELPPTCSSRAEKGAVCSTFDTNRLRGVPLVASVCREVLVARAPSDGGGGACDDALYSVFRYGLAGMLYETEHVLPRFGEID